MSEEKAQPSTEQSCAAFLSGGGEMGERIRTFDWAKTSLGPLEQWPQSLRIAVRIVLTSRQPFWLGWGEELIYLYNDPYRSIVGGRHPAAMGQPVVAVWPELEDIIKPMLSAAMAGREGTYVESQLLIMERYGYREETYYTFSYSPIPDESGENRGIICANTEDTRRVIGERQLALLRDLAAKTADVRSWLEACQMGLEALDSNARDMPFSMIYRVDADAQSFSLTGTSGIAANHSLAPQSVSAKEQSPWPLATVLETNDMVVVENLQALTSEPLPTGAWQEPPQCAAMIPLITTGQVLNGSVLIVGLNPFRLFDDDYRNFLNLVCRQIAASIANANAYEQERLRAEALAELHENQQRLHFAQLAGRVGVFEWLINGDRAVDEDPVIWSPELEALYGLETGTFEGNFEAWRKRVVPEDADIVIQGIESYLQERRTDYYDYEFRVILPDGQLRWLSGQAQFFYDEQNQPLRMIGVNVNIDERKKAEEMLREADNRKDEFLATLAHELRNPLAPLRNGLELLKLVPEHDRESTELAISMMERQLEQMVRLIDDLLDISRISLGRIKLHKERIELAESVRNAIETTRPLIEQMQHELIVDLPCEPIWLNADATRLAQVFSNLLNNAAKYTEPGGHIHLQIVCQTNHNQAVVTIKDDGIGIPQDMLSRVFELFTQVGRSLDKSSDGLGIGLSLVKNLLEMHDGGVEARSEGPGKGSEFIVSLPLAEPQATQSSQNSDATDGMSDESTGYRILVVDDNRDAANSLARILKLKGNNTRTAYNGREAITVAEQFRPEVMLLDIGMPELNGYDTARHIRKQPWGHNILIVALTGWGQEEDRQQSQAAGFDFHLVKPIDPAAIDKLLADEFEN